MYKILIPLWISNFLYDKYFFYSAPSDNTKPADTPV